MKKLFFIAILFISMGLVFTSCSGNNDKAKTEQLAKDETYTCTMHNEVMGDHPGKCPKCSMKLVKQKITAEQERRLKEGNYVKPDGQ